MSLDPSRFDALADRMLDAVEAAIEEQFGEAEAERQGGILTISLPDGGQYVLNKHGPNKQLWLSSPVSGAWHFEWNEARQIWTDSRGRGDFAQLLEGELAAKSGAGFSLG